ncbi:hypothetical protein FSW04_05350 [Baekduia soli]|uniref:Helix-turn-helix transcriptional regulator n=1 Tax=Baekduia soli TaxID=496014 RepID=A0A5B8U287_9ACTN|nr:hypothetical protein FSW04_05350 [Baekduia soli]
MLLRGATTAQVAERPAISPHTVSEHAEAIYDKTGARTRGEVAATVFFGEHLARNPGPRGRGRRRLRPPQPGQQLPRGDAARSPPGSGRLVDDRDRELEVGQAVGQVDMEPALDRVRGLRDDDLVDGLVEHHRVDDVHRVVADGDGRDHRAAGGGLDVGQRRVQRLLGRRGLVAALGVHRVPLGRRRVGHDHPELRGAAAGTGAHRVQQGRVGGAAVGEDQDARGLLAHAGRASGSGGDSSTRVTVRYSTSARIVPRKM